MNRRQLLAATTSALALAEIGARITMAQSGDPMTGNDPMRAAEYLSQLESNGYIPTLYTLYGYIHPDAEAIVPRATVIGWYQSDFLPSGPQPAVATSVTYLDSWTWGVTGMSYSNVAEVSFTQEFTNGETLNDVVRLIFHDGSWRWWFGRDAAWVEERNSRFNQMANTPQVGDAPFGLANLTNLDESTLTRLPETIDDAEFDGRYELALSAAPLYPDSIRQPISIHAYKPTEPPLEFHLGSIEYGSFVDFIGDLANLQNLARQSQNAPPVKFIGWNSLPAVGPAWLQTENAGVDVVGASYNMTLAMGGNYVILRMFSEDALGIVCEALAVG